MKFMLLWFLLIIICSLHYHYRSDFIVGAYINGAVEWKEAIISGFTVSCGLIAILLTVIGIIKDEQ